MNLLLPHFLAPSPTSLRNHLEEVLATIEPTPLVLQYAPALTGSGLDTDAVCEIAQRHPNFLYVKVEANPAGPLISRFKEGSDQLGVLVGYGGVQMLDALTRGAIGVQPGCSFVEIYLEVWRRFCSGDVSQARALHAKVLPFLSYWMQSVELIIAAEKLISKRRGLISTSYCRRPRYELDATECEMIDRFCIEFDGLLQPALASRPLSHW